MRFRREGDHFALGAGRGRFTARRRLDQGRGWALENWWGGFVGNYDTLDACLEHVRQEQPLSTREARSATR